MTDIATEQTPDTPIATLDYRDVEWVWVTSHYDIHLAGLCRYQGELCRFETHDDDAAPQLPPVSIYALTPAKKLAWLFNKKCFEWMVGRHLSYPGTGGGTGRPSGRPRWVRQSLFRLYYAGRDRLAR